MTSTDGVRVAVDAMGGDHGPSEVIPGALDFARSHPADEVILVGDDDDRPRHRRRAADQRPIVHAAEVIGMDEHPALALREKKDATILVATDLVRRGEADAVMTAGHTGAGMAAAVLRLGRLPGVDRPALAVQMITDAGPMVLLDIGANPDSTAENLAQYARMGAIFAERVLGVADPRVALLSIGEEKGKGDARIQRATELLDASDLRFDGNVEGKDLTHHLADVVVTDAVAGNVVIKFFEGLSGFIFDLWRAEFRRGIRGGSPTCSCAPGSIGSAASSTTSASAARRCSASRARSSSPTAEPSDGWSASPARSRRRWPGPASRPSSPRRWPPTPRDAAETATETARDLAQEVTP